MSISKLVPLEEAEMALLEESQREGKAIKTGELVKRAIKHFPQLTLSELQRRTPSGFSWWPGRFRFDLDRLKKRGEMSSATKAYWEITNLGIQRLAGPGQPSAKQIQNLSKSDKKVLDLIVETAKAVKKEEVPARITMGKGVFTIKLGKDIKKTKVLVAK